MKTSLALLALSLVPTFTLADTFNCDSSALEHLHVRVQNNVEASEGTRTAAILLVTDNQATYGSRTLISNTTIIQNGAFWTVETSTKVGEDPGQQIGDFARSELSKVQVYIPGFDFNEADKDGHQYAGHLFLFKSDDTEMFSQDVQLSCIYTTKN
jgi:hypothetical protein